MKKILLIISVAMFISCNQNTTSNQYVNSSDQINPNTSVRELLLERQKAIINEGKNYQGFYQNYKYVQHEDEILKSFQIIDEVEIPNTDIIAAFYSFNIGTTIIREVQYLIKEGDNYFIFNKYFSSYDDDPYNNGEPRKGKELLEKIDNWKEDNDQIIWY